MESWAPRPMTHGDEGSSRSARKLQTSSDEIDNVYPTLTRAQLAACEAEERRFADRNRSACAGGRRRREAAISGADG